MLEGEFYGLRGVLGTPLALHRRGWSIGVHTTPTSRELDDLKNAATAIHHAYQHLLGSSEAPMEHFDA